MKNEIFEVIQLVHQGIEKEKVLYTLYEWLTDVINKEVRNYVGTKEDKLDYLYKQLDIYGIEIDYFIDLQAYRNIEEYSDELE